MSKFGKLVHKALSWIEYKIEPSIDEKSEKVLANLRHGGAEIGYGCILFDPDNTMIDPTRPWLLSIGDYVKITRGVLVLTHDFSLSVMRRVYGDWVGEGQVTRIGDNVFLGMNSIVLMGSQIGNNVIVGAGSVVRGKIPDNVVVAGNPSKIVCTLEEHYRNRKEQTINEAVECARRYIKIFKKNPSIDDLGGFKWLFLPREEGIVKKSNIYFGCRGDDEGDIRDNFYSTTPYWETYDDFLQEVYQG